MKTVEFMDTKCVLQVDKYVNGNGVAITLYEEETGEPFMTVTTNRVGETLNDGEFLVKNYSENSGIAEAMIEQKIIEPIEWRQNKELLLAKFTQ